MKAKSRRRLLISSVAMLLVAMLALGTATFAWFTNSTTARAQNAQVTVSAPSGLVIAAVAHGETPAANAYASVISLAELTAGAMTPTSTDAVIDSGNTEPDFFAAQINSAKTVESVTTSTTYKAIDIYGKLSATNKGSGSTEIAKAVSLAAINNTISTTNKSGNIVRCAYFKADNSRLAYFHLGGNTARSVYPVTAAPAAGANLDDADANFCLVNTESFVSNTALATEEYDTATATGTAQFDRGTLLGTVYFWVEGQDQDCNNDHILTDVNTVIGQTGPLEFEFTLGDDVP